MKKILLTVASLSLVVVMGIMLAACSKDNKNSDVAGTYELYSITVNGMEFKEGSEIFEATKNEIPFSASFELTKDGKVKMGDVETGEWKQDGNKITIGDSDEGAFTVDGNNLVFEMTTPEMSMKIVYKKI